MTDLAARVTAALGRSVLPSVVARGGSLRVVGVEAGVVTLEASAELRIDTRQSRPAPAMLELAARSIGGLCARALRFPGGVSLEELVLANALGHRPPPPHIGRPSGVLMLHADRAGTLQAVDGKAEAAAIPGITGLTITVPVGQRLHPVARRRPVPRIHLR